MVGTHVLEIGAGNVNTASMFGHHKLSRSTYLHKTHERRREKASVFALFERIKEGQFALEPYLRCLLQAKPRGQTGSLETGEWVSIMHA
jgi:hypothetical protein